MGNERLLSERLQQILPLLKSEPFLKQRGIGNEIGYHLFDYDPQDEGVVREYLQKTLLPKRSSEFPFLAVHLFELMLKLLSELQLLDQVAELEEADGHEEMEQGLRTFLSAAELTQGIKRQLAPQDLFVVIYGVGEAWPILRSHELLNNLHAEIDRVPVVMFFPGRYDEEKLSPFQRVQSDNYYRAFQMIPRFQSTF